MTAKCCKYCIIFPDYSSLPQLPDVCFGEIIGSGQFASVRRATYHGKEVAIKIQSSYVREGEKMVGLNHPYIIKIHKVWHHENRSFIVMDYMSRGSLTAYFNSHLEEISIHHIIHFCLQIIDGMKCLVANHVVHCDLKMANILVDENEDIRISDFGLSRDTGYCLVGESIMNVKWSPPEAFVPDYILNPSFDVWSFGVLLWELFAFPAKPWETLSSPLSLGVLLSEGKKLDKPDNCDEEFYNVMLECWEFDPVKRPTFEELDSTFTKLQKQVCNA